MNYTHPETRPTVKTTFVIHSNHVVPVYSRANRWESLQRRLLLSFVESLSLPKGPWLDVGNHSPTFAQNLGGSPVHTVDLKEGAKFRVSADVDWHEVPSGFYECVISTNFLLLANDPQKVVDNIYRSLSETGIAVLDFVSLVYWYQGGDGSHRHTYNPTVIQDLMRAFKRVDLYPIGNFFQAAVNHYAKLASNKYVTLALNRMGSFLGRLDRNPTSAISYVAVGRK